MIRRLAAFAALAALGLSTAAPANADDHVPELTEHAIWPKSFALPDGFRPEGIAIGTAPIAYFGSLGNGSIYQVNLVTGKGSVLSVGPGTSSVGLKIDAKNRLFVAGGAAGDARVIDAGSGHVLASYQFATGSTFINDVVVTRDAAWFTDSFSPVLYKLPLGWRGDLPAADAIVRVPLTGDLVFTDGFNSNGIVSSPDGKSLLVVSSNAAKLYRVDPESGVTREVDLGGESLASGDGLLREGRTLYVVQNQTNQVATIELDGTGGKGRLISRVTDPQLDVPTTVAGFGRRLYLPNARFNTTPTPTTPYTVVAIDKP